MCSRLLRGSIVCAVLATVRGLHAPSGFFEGAGEGDAEEWLALLNTARAQFSPTPLLQDVSWLYTPVWDGFVEGPTWSAWWTQNSYGTTLAAALKRLETVSTQILKALPSPAPFVPSPAA